MKGQSAVRSPSAITRTLRGQSAVEYASILAIILIAMIPIVYVALSSIEDSTRSSQAQAAIVALTDASDLVLAQGPGSSTIVDVYMPRAVNPIKTNLTGKEIRINVFMTNGAEHDFFALTKGNLTGALPTTPGRHRLRVEMLYSGVVSLSEPT